MFPHIATVYNSYEGTNGTVLNVTILHGVLIDESTGTGNNRLGLSDADAVKMYIPLEVCAKGTSGTQKTYLPPREFYASSDKSSYWTLDTGGQASGVGTYFAKGEVVSSDSYAKFRAGHDGVYDVSDVKTRDFGGLQHFEVSGK